MSVLEVLRSRKRTFCIGIILGLVLSCVPSPLWPLGVLHIGVPFSWLDLCPVMFHSKRTEQEFRALVDQCWEEGCIGPTGTFTSAGWGWRWARLPGGWVIALRLEAMIGNVVLAVTGGILLRRSAQAWARRHDPRYQPGHCCGCGYDLTGNETGVCPECGRRTGDETAEQADG